MKDVYEDIKANIDLLKTEIKQMDIDMLILTKRKEDAITFKSRLEKILDKN